MNDDGIGQCAITHVGFSAFMGSIEIEKLLIKKLLIIQPCLEVKCKQCLHRVHS